MRGSKTSGKVLETTHVGEVVSSFFIVDCYKVYRNAEESFVTSSGIVGMFMIRSGAQLSFSRNVIFLGFSKKRYEYHDVLSAFLRESRCTLKKIAVLGIFQEGFRI